MFWRFEETRNYTKPRVIQSRIGPVLCYKEVQNQNYLLGAARRRRVVRLTEEALKFASSNSRAKTRYIHASNEQYSELALGPRCTSSFAFIWCYLSN